MTRIVTLTMLASALALALATPAAADPDRDMVKSFLVAQHDATLNGTAEAIERYLSFMAPDMIDQHRSYGVAFEGTAHIQNNLPDKAEKIATLQYSNVVIDVQGKTATLEYTGMSRAPDAALDAEPTSTENLVILTFDDQDRIAMMKRYSTVVYRR